MRGMNAMAVYGKIGWVGDSGRRVGDRASRKRNTYSTLTRHPSHKGPFPMILEPESPAASNTRDNIPPLLAAQLTNIH